jgi:hypothetical protein
VAQVDAEDARSAHSDSIVLGGFEVTPWTTRLMPINRWTGEIQNTSAGPTRKGAARRIHDPPNSAA